MLIQLDIARVGFWWLLSSAVVGVVCAVIRKREDNMWGALPRAFFCFGLCALSPLVVPTLLLLEAFLEEEGTD